MKRSIIFIIAYLGLQVYGQEFISSDEWRNRILTIDVNTGLETNGILGDFTGANLEGGVNEDIFPLLWQKIYSKNSLDHGRYAQKAVDNGYIITGRTLVEGDTDFDGWIIKTDFQGNVLWDKTYGDYYVDELEVIRTTSDNAYLAIGTSTMFGNSGEGWMLKVDDNGETLWNKGFHSPLSTGWDFLYDVIEIEDNSYVAVGFANSTSTQGWIIKVDKFGNEIWNHEYGDQYWERLFSVKQTDDGGFIAVGDKHIQYENVIGHDGWLVKFDSEGNLLWERTYGTIKNDIFRDIFINTDGSFTITGERVNENTNNSESWIMKTDAEGNVIYNKSLGGGGLVASIELENTNSIVCANRNQQTVLILIDAEGNTLNEQLIRYGNIDDRATSMQITENGHVILGGRANAHTQAGDFWLVTLGEENVVSTSGLFYNKLSVYPNPAKDYFCIQSETQINRIRIFDANGKLLIKKESINENTFFQDTHKLSSGLYFVEIVTWDKIQFEKIIVN